MFYIHQSSCISAQQSFPHADIAQLHPPADNKLKAREPSYEGIPPGMLRRMGTAIRLGVGSALPLIKNSPPLDGIIIGTAKGGMEDSVKFLNQIVQYEEGVLTPGNFVQSTTNAIAGQLGLFSKNKGYNITHTQRGLAFENAAIDAGMRLSEFPRHRYLLEGVDEVSGFNHNLERLEGAYKSEVVTSEDFYNHDTPGSIAGEGAAAFIVSSDPANAIAHCRAVATLHRQEPALVREWMSNFMYRHCADQLPQLLISGENGDNRVLHYYLQAEQLVGKQAGILRFKHMTGEYPTASAIAFWLACELLRGMEIPTHLRKKKGDGLPVKDILIYNNFKGMQHSLMLLSAV